MNLLAFVLALSPAVYGERAFAHLCPVSPTEAFTAKHVSTARPMFTEPYRPALIFTQRLDGLAAYGVVREVASDEARDLSLVHIVAGDRFLRHYPVAKQEPVKGERVTITGFDMAKGAVPVVLSAKVLFSDGPLLTYDRSPGPGSSGSCVLNSKDEIVAINRAMSSDERPLGFGVSVWGRWQAFLVETEVER